MSSQASAPPKVRVVDDVTISVFPARQAEIGRYRADAIIVWPDGSYDVGAASIDGPTAIAAQKAAEQKALDRYVHILDGSLSKTHPDAGAISR